MKIAKILLDLGYTIVPEVHDYHVEFKVYKFVCEQGGVFEYQKADSESMNLTTNLDEAEVYLRGSVKWDGCSNWHFDEQDRVMLHFCDHGDLLNLGVVMATCWEMAEELCPNFDRG
jgi:hypothetical protein